MTYYLTVNGRIIDARKEIVVSSDRPVVVIDPEDREQVERLADAILTEAAGYSIDRAIIVCAFEKFASPTPPKPEEPTGLGAVVRDTEGFYYSRGYTKGESTHQWHVVDPAIRKRMSWWKWEDMDVTEVLSPGVPVE